MIADKKFFFDKQILWITPEDAHLISTESLEFIFDSLTKISLKNKNENFGMTINVKNIKSLKEVTIEAAVTANSIV